MGEISKWAMARRSAALANSKKMHQNGRIEVHLALFGMEFRELLATVRPNTAASQ
ncbi:MAG: hypothetical protein GY820_25370 [Gammaproteobacteria bacterium]|nr:hypothetical protein [Gammaproteobacteria bacterium]